VRYGGKTFDDYSQHPNIAEPIRSGPNAGKTSSAAGRYQFIKSTWDAQAKKLGLTDFSPASQDKAAWDLAATEYKKFSGHDLLTDLKNHTLDPKGMQGIRNQWTSAPGGIEQGRGNTMQAFTANYEKQLAQQQKLLPANDNQTPAPLLPEQQAAAAPWKQQPQEPQPNMDSQHSVEVAFMNAPQGMRTGLKTLSQGNSNVTLRTETAMSGGDF
jgi:muramidase (phage lysozyme)